MTTAAQYLVALSGLSGVSAGAHLMAITAGTGATIFTSQMTIVSETPQRTIYNKPKRTAPQTSQPKPVAQKAKGSKYSHLVTASNEQVILSEANEGWIVEAPAQSTTVFTRPNEVSTQHRNRFKNQAGR